LQGGSTPGEARGVASRGPSQRRASSSRRARKGRGGEEAPLAERVAASVIKLRKLAASPIALDPGMASPVTPVFAGFAGF